MDNETRQRIEQFLVNDDYVNAQLVRIMEYAAEQLNMDDVCVTQLFESRWSIKIESPEPSYPWTDDSIPTDEITGEDDK